MAHKSSKPVPESTARKEKPERASFSRRFFGTVAALLMAASAVILTLMAFFYSLRAKDTTIAGAEAWMKRLFGNPLLLILAIVLALVMLVLTILLNRRQNGRILSAIAFANLFAGLVLIGLACFGRHAVPMLTDELQTVLIRNRNGMESFLLLSAGALTVIAAILLSVRFCIGLSKRTLSKKQKAAILIQIVLFVLLAAAMLLLQNVFPTRNASAHTAAPVMESGASLEETAAGAEEVDINPENGIVYVNNEVLIYFADSASESSIEDFLTQFDAEADRTLADLGIYKLVFPKAMRYDELEDLLREIRSNSLVEEAGLNPVIAENPDVSADTVAHRDPLLPSDNWGDVWNVSVPRGTNWGMEAINAPGAWGYRDLLSSVRIGQIDTSVYAEHPDLSIPKSRLLSVVTDASTGLLRTDSYLPAPESHGTHVAGIMNAAWNNGVGVSGVMAGLGESYCCTASVYSGGSYYNTYATGYSYLCCFKTLLDQNVRAINISQNTSRLIGFAASRGNANAIRHLEAQADVAERGLKRIIASRISSGSPDFLICVSAGNSNNTVYYPDPTAIYGYSESPVGGAPGQSGNSDTRYNNFLALIDDPAVMDRIVVVGAVGIDYSASTPLETRYSYASFSNIGARVDVCAPGVDVYSTVLDAEGAYASYSGTSMAAPHVTGVAGLVFAANPDLTGPQAKQILLASTTGLFSYTGGSSGMINACTAVVNALQTRDHTVKEVVSKSGTAGLDLCFVVDTTGSMGDDIGNAKEHMSEILNQLSEKTEDYRVALIDYRDYASRTHDGNDYPCRLQLAFTSDPDAITEAINALDLGYGGDEEETVYSGLMEAVRQEWRPDAKKVIIVLGDAAPLDPEPETGYTYDDVLTALITAEIGIDAEASDERVLEGMDSSEINVYTIGTGDSSDSAEDFFRQISEGTGGSYAGTEDASEVSDAIIESIDKIDMASRRSVDLLFDRTLADQKIDLYRDGEYLLTVQTDAISRVNVPAIEIGEYEWKADSPLHGGSLVIGHGGSEVEANLNNQFWFAPITKFASDHTLLTVLLLEALLILCILTPVIVWISSKRRRAAPVKRPSAVEAYLPELQLAQNPAVPQPQTWAAPPQQPQVQPAPTAKPFFCTNCGARLEAGTKYCPYCGKKF